MEASLLLASQDVPDDDGLRVLLGVHQWAERHHVPANQDGMVVFTINVYVCLADALNNHNMRIIYIYIFIWMTIIDTYSTVNTYSLNAGNDCLRT